MSYAPIHKEVTLYTNRNTRLFSLKKFNGVFRGQFIVELVSKRGIYDFGDTFSLSVNFSAPDIANGISAAAAAKKVTTSVTSAYKSNNKSGRHEVIEYELSLAERALINKAIITALQPYPAIPSVVTLSDAPAVARREDDAEDAAEGDDATSKKVRTFINGDSDQDNLVRYDDSAHGHLTVVADNKYWFAVEFDAAIDENVVAAKYTDGNCIRERVEVINSIEITHLRVAGEINNTFDKDIIDISKDEVVDYTVGAETRELIKSAIIEDIKNTPKA